MALDLGTGQALQYVLPMMRGSAVLALQRALIPKFLPSGEDDGLFGPATRDAVRRFQTSRGISATGIVDPATARHLRDAATPRSPATQNLRVVPAEHLPDAAPERIILHWTAGGARASELDRKHYHFLVQQDGSVVRGVHGIDANDRPRRGHYAAHTLNKNTKSVGLSLCGMHNAKERPFRSGPVPIVESQLINLARLVAQICARYGIPVSRTTVLGHGEVQSLLNVAQNGKWDPLVLPWRTELSFREVGDMLRAMASAELNRAQRSEEAPGDQLEDIGLRIAGTDLPGVGVVYDCATWARMEPLCTALGWSNFGIEEDGVRVAAGSTECFLPVRILPGADGIGNTPCVRIDDLAEQLNLSPKIMDDGALICLQGEVGGAIEMVRGEPTRQITVARGETLSRIARRELGDSGRWTELRDAAGQRYDEASARQIKPGDIVLLPVATPDTGDTAGDEPEDKREPEFFEAFGLAAESAAHPVNRAAAREAGVRIARACFEAGVTDLSHIAYIFATAQHETNFGRTMVEVWRGSAQQRKYQNHPSNAPNNPGDGKLYRGRGYVQLTFRENYRKFGRALDLPLEDDPTMAADPDIAAKVLVIGMSRVGYRSPRLVLPQFGFDDDFDFFNARRIVNADRDTDEPRYGTSRGSGIARQARDFRAALVGISI